jgi:hypothetical protein
MKNKFAPKKTIVMASLLVTGLAAQAQPVRTPSKEQNIEATQQISLSQEEIQTAEFGCGLTCGASCGHTAS